MYDLGITQGNLAKAGTVGLAAYGISMVNGYGGSELNIYGRAIPFTMFIAATAGIGSIVADMSHATLFHYLPLPQKYDQIEAAATSAAVSFGAFYGLIMVVDARIPQEMGALDMLGTTLLANAVGDYAYSTVLAPMFE